MITKRVLFVVTIYLFSVCALAQERQFDDWNVGAGESGDFLFAATTNDSGEMLGEYCYASTGKCLWLLGMKTPCEEKDSYVLLANSSSRAKALEVTCAKDLGDGTHIYVFDWKELESVIKGASWVGLAFPMQKDAFKVVRFSLNGSGGSTDLLESAFQKMLDNGKTTQGTKTQIM